MLAHVAPSLQTASEVSSHPDQEATAVIYNERDGGLAERLVFVFCVLVGILIEGNAAFGSLLPVLNRR
jgi:hypothetical protein